MAKQLSGKQIVFMMANEGVEQIELTPPWQAVEVAGGRPVLAAPLVGVGDAAGQDQTVDPAVHFVREFFRAGKPVAVICHGPWTLVEAAVVKDRTLTSWPSIQTDIRNAGGTWVDKEVVVCIEGPNTLVTSRKPDDLDAFCAAMVEAFQAGGAR